MPAAVQPVAAAKARPSLKQVANVTLREQVTQAVRSALMNGHFQPGQAVTVKAISEMLGSGVMPSREAMNRLIAEGALELRANRTVIVPVVSRHEFDELTDLRCHVEGTAASQAVGHVGPEHLARLREIDRAMRAAGRRGDAEGYLDGNFQFHFSIYRLGASPFMLSIIEKLWVRVGPLIRACVNDIGLSDSRRHHASILESLEAGEAGELRQAIVADITVAAQTIRAVQARQAARAGDGIRSVS
ncbi:MAG: GntR family transcriptional regulator [Comamonadaceae bacterium]|nr:MAG: GntR family transcriptional regulator [Comamonadaceae bacterium]